MQKNGIGKGMNQIRIKSLLAQEIADEILRTKWRNAVKLDRKKNFGICFCVFLIVITKG